MYFLMVLILLEPLFTRIKFFGCKITNKCCLGINAEPNQKMQCLFKDDKKEIGTLVIHTIEVEIQQMVRH